MTDSKSKLDHRKEDKAEDAKKKQKVELNDLESTKDPKGGLGRGGGGLGGQI